MIYCRHNKIPDSLPKHCELTHVLWKCWIYVHLIIKWCTLKNLTPSVAFKFNGGYRGRMVVSNYLCNQYLSSLTLWVRIPLRWGVLDTALCDRVCQWLAIGRWFSPGTPVSSTNKTDCQDITKILLKVTLNTIILTL